jgi:hypothetical protein
LTRLPKISQAEMQSLSFRKEFLSMFAQRTSLRRVGRTGHGATEKGNH